MSSPSSSSSPKAEAPEPGSTAANGDSKKSDGNRSDGKKSDGKKSGKAGKNSGTGKRHADARPGHRRGGVGGGIHGEFVVPGASGSFRTVAVQRGDVTKVSAESITVGSADGFSRAYTVTAATVVNTTREGFASLTAGDQVRITAMKKDDRFEATHVSDMKALHPGKAKLRERAPEPNGDTKSNQVGPAPPGKDSSQPAPAPSAST